MEIQDFIEKIIEAVEIEDASSCQATTEFRKLDVWNSLAALSVIAMADEEYDVTVKGDEIRQATTIEDLFHLVQSKRSNS